MVELGLLVEHLEEQVPCWPALEELVLVVLVWLEGLVFLAEEHLVLEQELVVQALLGLVEGQVWQEWAQTLGP